MQAYECTAKIDALGALHLPDEITAQMMSRKVVRVLVLLDEQGQQQAQQTEEQRAWNTLAASEFLRGYSDADAIYDAL
jgi:hypothetical protein